MKIRRKEPKKLKAFSLTEILIVLAVIGILLMLYLPNQTAVIAKANAVEAKSHLKQIHGFQKSYFYENSRYSNSLDEIGYITEPTVNEGGGLKYSYEIVEAAGNSFVARATAVVDFNGNGQFNVWEINHEGQLKEVTKD